MKVYEQRRQELAAEMEPIAEAAYNAYTDGTRGYRPLTWNEISEAERERWRRVTGTVVMAREYGIKAVS